MKFNSSSWLARQAFATGRPEDSVPTAVSLDEVIDADPNEAAMMARFALHAGRADVAKVVLDAIGRLHGGLIDNDIANLRAGLAAADGRVTDALTLYRSAIAGYREMGCRFDVALAVLDMAALIGPDEPAVRAAIPEGREILVSLGAQTLLERLDALESIHVASTQPTRSSVPIEVSSEG